MTSQRVFCLRLSPSFALLLAQSLTLTLPFGDDIVFDTVRCPSLGSAGVLGLILKANRRCPVALDLGVSRRTGSPCQ